MKKTPRTTDEKPRTVNPRLYNIVYVTCAVRIVEACDALQYLVDILVLISIRSTRILDLVQIAVKFKRLCAINPAEPKLNYHSNLI